MLSDQNILHWFSDRSTSDRTGSIPNSEELSDMDTQEGSTNAEVETTEPAAQTTAKPKATRAAKKAKRAKPVKAKAKSHSKPKTKIAKKPRKPSKETLLNHELNDREKRLLAAFGGVGKKKTITELGDIAFKRERPAAKRMSWARNNLRYFVNAGMVKKVDRGTYVRRA